MRRKIGIIICLLFIGIIITVSGLAQAEYHLDRFALFTPAEALQLRMSTRELEDFQQNLFFSRDCEAGEAPTAGPYIKVQNPRIDPQLCPPAITCTSPLDLSVLFETNQAPVDMESLEVSARKGFFSTSLTLRLRPYIHGTGIFAENIEIPAGCYCITFSIADAQGAETVRTYGLNVLP